MLGAYLLVSSVVDFHHARQFDDWWSRQRHIDTFLLARLKTPVNLAATVGLKRELTPDAPDAALLRLQLQRGEWDDWQRSTVDALDRWFDATLRRDGGRRRVKIRARGDTSVHWGTNKKSFTLKTPKSTHYKGYRRLAYSGKQVLRLYLSNSLAREFGVMAPFTTVAPVFLNERFYGMFRVCELIDESFLRRQGRMPGSIFRGDAAERGEYFKGLPRPLFANPYIWDRVAVSGDIDDQASESHRHFLAHLNGTTFDDHLRFMEFLDRRDMVRFVAYLLAVGDMYHMSGVHNQFWYLDPSSGLFHPIPWDVYLYHLDQPAGRINRCLRSILRDPFIVEAALRMLHHQISNGELQRRAYALLTNIHDRYENHFAYDRVRRPMISDVGSPNDVLAILDHNVNLLQTWISDTGIAFHAELTHSHAILDFQTRTHVGADLTALEIEGYVTPRLMPQVAADTNCNGVHDESDRILAGDWTIEDTRAVYRLKIPLPMVSGIEGRIDGRITPDQTHYRLFLLPDDGKAKDITSIRPQLRNRFTSEVADVLPWQPNARIETSTSWHPWAYAVRSPKRHRLHGEVVLANDLTVETGDTLVIEPGTRCRMAPGVSILVRGRLLARGDSQRPITFEPVVSGRPWGVLALQGQGANESILEHARFVGGGGATFRRVRYKGMVCVHWTDNVTFRDCTFADNLQCDDALNVVHSRANVVDSAFLRTNADAIDFDYSSGTILNCTFDGARNDAIDLMNSDPIIQGNHITRSGDKGVSIGELSHPILLNNTITRSLRGIEVKDRSEPYVVHNKVTGNTVGIHQALKNWRYGGGGWAKLVHSVITNNTTDLYRDTRSRLTTIDFQSQQIADTDHSLQPHASNVCDCLLGSDSATPLCANPGPSHCDTSFRPRITIISATFVDDFESVTNDWTSSGGVYRLYKRNDDLVMMLRQRPGAASRMVEWDLTDAQFDYHAILEISSQNVVDAHVAFRGTAPPFDQPIVPTEVPSAYRYLCVQLPVAHYQTIALAATPLNGTGRVALHGYRVFAIPRSEASAATVPSTDINAD